MAMNKRPADSPATKDGPAKKTTSSASAPKQQSSLLAWAKPKATVAAITTNSTTTNGDKTSSEPVSAPLILRAKPDILKGLSDEKRELLRLEQDTIDATWLRALQSEFTKPYFIEVCLFGSVVAFSVLEGFRLCPYLPYCFLATGYEYSSRNF
jgi:uracil-DNA glycosylase